MRCIASLKALLPGDRFVRAAQRHFLGNQPSPQSAIRTKATLRWDRKKSLIYETLEFTLALIWCIRELDKSELEFSLRIGCIFKYEAILKIGIYK